MATLVSLSPIQRLTANIAQQIVGKDRAIQLVLTALFAGGHVLLEDVPGVGKTLLAKSRFAPFRYYRNKYLESRESRI
jgi:MoxR-like ATPase